MKLSYKETAEILGQTLQNTKNLVHRGKKELRKILLKKGFDEMNKVSKIFIIGITTIVVLSGIVYATSAIYNNYIKNNANHKITMNPSYQSTLDENTINNLWIATLDLAWKATMVTEYLSASLETKYCYFNDTFIVFMKEQNCDKPYFALKVDNTDILEKKEETDEPKVTDHTMMVDSERYKVEEGEYKFFDDENYEYYYPTQKSKLVQVWFKNGDIMTAEEALKQGKITMELLDKYGVEHIKREKGR